MNFWYHTRKRVVLTKLNINFDRQDFRERVELIIESGFMIFVTYLSLWCVQLTIAELNYLEGVY